jgi:hypothetical protein
LPTTLAFEVVKLLDNVKYPTFCTNIIIIFIIIIWLYSPIRALVSPFWVFVTITFLQGWIVSPAPNPQPGGPGLRIYDPRRQGGPAIPILVAFYDMHGLQWDFSLIPATTRDSAYSTNFNLRFQLPFTRRRWRLDGKCAHTSMKNLTSLLVRSTTSVPAAMCVRPTCCLQACSVSYCCFVRQAVSRTLLLFSQRCLLSECFSLLFCVNVCLVAMKT